MIRLFFENKEVELDNSAGFAITKQFEDITSPADIKNDWSKTVKIPFTANNNTLFGNLFSVDRLIVEGDYRLMGVYFNPLKKVDFRLQWGDLILMQGYAKNISVEKTENGGYYNITLNGELGKIFQEMKKITFDRTTDNTEYLIDGSKYISELINKELIYDLWSNEEEITLDLLEKDDEGYSVKQYINFAPNNSFDKDFNYKNFQYTITNSKTFEEQLNDEANRRKEGEQYSYFAGVDAGTIIDNGLLPREIGEYRSWLQLPFIYFNKLFQIFLKKTEEITGYSAELDERWFNSENPYWGRLVYMLKRLFSDRKGEDSKNTRTQTLESVAPQKQSGNWNTFTTNTTIRNTDFTNKQILYNCTFNSPINVRCTNFTEGLWGGLANNAGIEIYMHLYDENNELYNTQKFLLISPTSTYNYEDIYTNVYVLPNSTTKVKTINNFGYSTSLIGNSTIKWQWRFVGNGSTYFFQNAEGEGEEQTDSSATFVAQTHVAIGDVEEWNTLTNTYSTINSTIEDYSNILHTDALFTLNDLWDNSYNLFDEIIDYCKIYRIGVFCDDIHKKLIFKPLANYFENYKILDWTDKVDYSKSYTINPITFENKYLLFNYKGVNTAINDSYKQKYGVNYGEFKLTTDYEFNNDVKELFNGVNNSVCSTDYVMSWKNLYNNMKYIYTIPKEVYVHNRDKDKNNVDLFGCMFIYNGLVDFDDSEMLRNVFVSDDSQLQAITRDFFYSQDINSIRVEKYPYLNVKNGNDNNITLFTKPMESYIYDDVYFDNTRGIYNNFWENYLDERYNIQNKLLTCYVRLSPHDYSQFEFKNFVKIGNQVYMVNKIYDYTINDIQPTKVDLITIQDIEGYYVNNFSLFNIYQSDGITPWDKKDDYIQLRADDKPESTIYLTSNYPCVWNDELQSLQSLYVNGVNYGGEIPAGQKVPITFKMLDNVDERGVVKITNGIDSIEIDVVLIAF